LRDSARPGEGERKVEEREGDNVFSTGSPEGRGFQDQEQKGSRNRRQEGLAGNGWGGRKDDIVYFWWQGVLAKKEGSLSAHRGLTFAARVGRLTDGRGLSLVRFRKCSSLKSKGKSRGREKGKESAKLRVGLKQLRRGRLGREIFIQSKFKDQEEIVQFNRARFALVKSEGPGHLGTVEESLGM